jgi:hypothetical protein
MLVKCLLFTNMLSIIIQSSSHPRGYFLTREKRLQAFFPKTLNVENYLKWSKNNCLNRHSTIKSIILSAKFNHLIERNERKGVRTSKITSPKIWRNHFVKIIVKNTHYRSELQNSSLKPNLT